MPYADLKRGFLSDSLQESPQKIGPLGYAELLKRPPFGGRTADRPEAEW
ncbi:MAG: hypothetical protein V2B13_19815 [Pseudomonadota bacterium]